MKTIQLIMSIDAMIQRAFDACVYRIMRTFEVSKYVVRQQLWLALILVVVVRIWLHFLSGGESLNREINCGMQILIIHWVRRMCLRADQAAERAGKRSSVDQGYLPLKLVWWSVLTAQAFGVYDQHLLVETLNTLGWLAQEYLRRTNPTPPARKSPQQAFALSPQPA